MPLNQTLTRFVKDECANFDKHYQVCIDGKPCKVLSGKQCGYFERAVLGPADYKFRLPQYDYQKLFAQYAEQTETEPQTVQQRRCTCGNPVRHRQRFCDKCSQNRKLESKRKWKQKKAG